MSFGMSGLFLLESLMPLPVFDGFLYDRHGTKIAVVTELTISHDLLDITTHLDHDRHFVQGMRRTTIQAQGVEGLTFDNREAWRCDYCGGMQPSQLDGKFVTNCSNCGGARRK